MIVQLIAFLAMAGQPAAGRPLTQVRDSYPHLSPDGASLLFHSNRSGRQAIWIARSDGSDIRLFFDDPAAGSDPGTAVWSTDGRHIAFAMKPAGAIDENESEIYAIDSDGANLRRLTNAPGDDSHPHWSRSGRIYFNSAQATPDLTAPWSQQWIDIYSMAADGSDVRRHTDCRSVCTYPVPSPDERSVAHRRVTNTPGQVWDLTASARNSEIFVTPLDGGAPLNVSNSPAYDGWPMWSPDGRWLVFASNRDGVAYTGQIYAVRPDGRDLRPLTSGIWSRVQPSFNVAGDMLYVYQSMENAEFEIGHIARFDIELGQ